MDTLWWNDIVVGQTRVSSHWNREVGQKYKVYTYTNGDEVELFVNGKSIGVKPNSDKRKPNVIVWDGIQYEPGTIKAILRSSKDQAGKVKITATCNGLKSVTKTVMTKN